MVTAVRGEPSRRTDNGDSGRRVRANRRRDTRRRLRRGVLIGAILSAAPFSAASAQPAVGVLTGFSRASFTGGGSRDAVARTTFLIGGVGEIAFGEMFSLRSELYFSEKGARVETLLGDPRSGPTKLFRVPYVQLPLLAQLRTPLGGHLRPHLFGGMSVGALLGCELGDEGCDEIEEIGYRSVDLGVMVGGELEWSGIAVGVRYEAGIRAVEASVLGNELYNGVLSFTARYIFRRGAAEDG